jgi:primosomal protein N' (replication factor Y)
MRRKFGTFFIILGILALLGAAALMVYNLNEEQQAAFNGLSEKMDAIDPGIALLYGVTGSGKTSVYLKLIQKCLENGKSALLLVPEIALTPQLLGLLAAYFGSHVAVLHSSLSAGERYDQWKRVKSG